MDPKAARLLVTWRRVVEAMAPLTISERRQIFDALEIMLVDFERRKDFVDRTIDPTVVAEIAAKLTRGGERAS